jgi:two-component system NarL family sensor kinase
MDLRMDAYWNFSEILYETGNYQKSHEYLLNFLAIKDSIYDLKKSQFIYDLTLKYEKEKDQARILTLEKENLKKTIQRNSILYSGLGLILLAIFIILFFRQRAVKDKIIARQKIKQLEEEKKLMVAKMMIEGQEEERKRIARELHDGLGVLLSATKMQFTAIKDVSPENRPMVDKAIQLLEQASGDVRKISHNMMPGLLTKLGFFEAVEDLFDNLNDTGNLKAILKINGSQERLPENREIMLYRIVQEMINNTLKYAEAHKIKLIINVMTDHLTMVFADDGKGFDVEKVLKSDTDSIGLKSIQSRVNFLNGEVTLESRPGEGVKYSFRVPLI